jgi:hypothetical protein
MIHGSKADRSAPEVLEPMRRQLGVAHGVLDVLVIEMGLQRGILRSDARARQLAQTGRSRGRGVAGGG